MRSTGVRPARRMPSTRDPSMDRDRAHASISATARSRWPCADHSRSNIGDLAGIRTYSVSAGTIASSHVRWTNSPSFLGSMLMMPDGSIVAKEDAMRVPGTHYVNGTPLVPPFPEGLEVAMFGMGCFWGAERVFWKTPGVFSTAVGYAAGVTPDPDYEQVCSGLTGHAEVVRVVFDPARVSCATLLRLFWESHDPTQGMRQGNDVGTQYRSGIYVTTPEQRKAAEASKAVYEKALAADRYGPITTEIADAGEFYFAEDYHQQYLAKNPAGYCGLGGTGLALGDPAASCPVGIAETPAN